jgi:hypothetical protein
MYQRLVCGALTTKQLSADSCPEKLVGMLASRAVLCLTLTMHPERRKLPAISSQPPDGYPKTIIDRTILDIVDARPFACLRRMARTC